MIKIVIVDDDAEIRELFGEILSAEADFRVVGQFENVKSAAAALTRLKPDVVLLDIDMPGVSGIDGLPLLRSRLAGGEIIMVTVHQEPDKVFEALCRGARGYLTKIDAAAKLVASVRELVAGGAPMSSAIARLVVASFRKTGTATPLTGREREVLRALCDGNSYKTIADKLNISRQTVHSHIKNIYRKLEVHSQTEAVARAFRDGLV